MKMQNAEMEFVAFDAQDVIMTSTTGGGANAIKFVLSYDLVTGYGSSDFATFGSPSGNAIVWYTDENKENPLYVMHFAGLYPNLGDTVYLGADATVFYPYNNYYSIVTNATTSEIDGAVEKSSLSEILDWLPIYSAQ